MKNAKFHFAKSPELTGKILRVETAVVCGKKIELAVVSFDSTDAAIPLRYKCERKPSVAGYKLTDLVISKERAEKPVRATLKTSLNAKQLCCLVNSQEIYDRLCAQQGAYMMTKNGLKVVPVKSDVLREYAKLCCKRFTENLIRCKTDNDYAKLHAAYLEMTARGGTDFLTPIGVTTTRPEIGDIIDGHQVTEVRADGAVFGVKGTLPKRDIEALRKHFASGAKEFVFRPGYHFLTIAK